MFDRIIIVDSGILVAGAPKLHRGTDTPTHTVIYTQTHTPFDLSNETRRLPDTNRISTIHKHTKMVYDAGSWL